MTEDLIVFDSHFMEGEFCRIEVDLIKDPILYYFSRPFWDDDARDWTYPIEEFDSLDELIKFVKKS